jgi:hypothetical protein
MRIERTKFLVLTGALSGGAGGACGAAQPTPTDVGNVVSIPAAASPPPPTSALAQAPREVRLDGGPKPVLPEVTDEDEADDDDDSLASTFRLSPQPAKCDNAAGNPSACAALKAPGPTCEGFADTKEQCGKMRGGFKARVAEKAVACFLTASATRAICGADKPTKCALLALQSACIEPATEAKCRAVLAACGRGRRGSALTMDLCQAALSGVTDRNRAKLGACMAEGCDVTGCLWDLK